MVFFLVFCIIIILNLILVVRYYTISSVRHCLINFRSLEIRQTPNSSKQLALFVGLLDRLL